ncbi:MAG: DNA/RNA non-specific endonuclease [Alistipes sp.]|nr:DNA/RNA non-specific endonuclease [Alistipes sp.]MDY5199288.1 DNA/RNA non-specific endonuclease [Candidatus Cryptobacteroides sp.]
MKITLSRFWMICAGVVMLALSSCGSGGKEDVLPPIVEVKTAVVEAGGYSQFIYVKASSSWRITITSVDGGEPVDWIIADPSSGSGDMDVTLKVEENKSEKERSAVITVENSAGKASKTISQKAKGSEVKPDPTPSGGNLSPKTGWMELPAIPNGMDAFTHSMTVGSVSTRNYSFLWDYSNLVAPWVAYPLCKWNIGNNIKRTNAWGLDPLLPEGKQPVLFRGFSEGNNGWYARGHQIPSADRLTSYESNSMTFYGTNMTPQIQDGFNGDIWATLEGKVRSWANSSDTLYVVTGCVIDYPEGQTVKYALDNYGKKVTVPTAYYKVVLRYMKNSTVGYSGYSACAVWLDHKVYSTKNIDSKYSMSVKDLEKKVGMDFFVNLPAVVGEEMAAKIESEDPSKVSWWW